jgi:hypothetical protein
LIQVKRASVRPLSKRCQSWLTGDITTGKYYEAGIIKRVGDLLVPETQGLGRLSLAEVPRSIDPKKGPKRMYPRPFFNAQTLLTLGLSERGTIEQGVPGVVDRSLLPMRT